ncbi:MAG: hypothetical protein ABIO35_11680 [Nitrobacter sp.]
MVTQLNYKNDARRQQVVGAATSERERLAAEIEALEEHIRLHDGAQSSWSAVTDLYERLDARAIA